jgi:hypothetical protein
MSVEFEPAAGPAAFDLAQIPPFRLGGLSVDPARCSVEREGRRARLQVSRARPRRSPRRPGMILLEIDTFEAAPHVERAVELDPNDAETLIWLGQVQFARGLFEKARLPAGRG